MTDYVLVGGGGFARELHDWFTPGFRSGDRFVGYLDDFGSPMKAFGRDLPHLGDTHQFRPDPTQRLVLALGDPSGKAALVERLSALGGMFAALIHPSAWVSASAKLGRGVIIGPFCDVSADTVAGDYVTLNAYSSIGHDAQVGSFSTLSGYVDLTGAVKVGSSVFFGSGSRVLPGVKIGDRSVIGAGAVVVRNVPAGSTLYAAPARRFQSP